MNHTYNLLNGIILKN